MTGRANPTMLPCDAEPGDVFVQCEASNLYLKTTEGWSLVAVLETEQIDPGAARWHHAGGECLEKQPARRPVYLLRRAAHEEIERLKNELIAAVGTALTANRRAAELEEKVKKAESDKQIAEDMLRASDRRADQFQADAKALRSSLENHERIEKVVREAIGAKEWRRILEEEKKP